MGNDISSGLARSVIYVCYMDIENIFSNTFSLFQLLQLFNFYKQCWQYTYMLPLRNLFLNSKSAAYKQERVIMARIQYFFSVQLMCENSNIFLNLQNRLVTIQLAEIQ